MLKRRITARAAGILALGAASLALTAAGPAGALAAGTLTATSTALRKARPFRWTARSTSGASGSSSSASPP